MSCVIVGGASISDYGRARNYLKDDDYLIYCDSGLNHIKGLNRAPDLIIGDFDSHEDPHMDVETITLPVAKDDTDTVYAAKEGMKRGYRDFILLGAVGERIDHSLVNLYILTLLDKNGCRGMIADDYSETELISASPDKSPAKAEVEDCYAYFSLIAIDGPAVGVSIRNAKFGLDDAEINADYQYAISNEVLPEKTAEITLRKGRLLLIKIHKHENRRP